MSSEIIENNTIKKRIQRTALWTSMLRNCITYFILNRLVFQNITEMLVFRIHSMFSVTTELFIVRSRFFFFFGLFVFVFLTCSITPASN